MLLLQWIHIHFTKKMCNDEREKRIREENGREWIQTKWKYYLWKLLALCDIYDESLPLFLSFLCSFSLFLYCCCCYYSGMHFVITLQLFGKIYSDFFSIRFVPMLKKRQKWVYSGILYVFRRASNHLDTNIDCECFFFHFQWIIFCSFISTLDSHLPFSYLLLFDKPENFCRKNRCDLSSSNTKNISSIYKFVQRI